MRILIVEDDPDWSSLLRHIVEMNRHECVGVATSVEEAICASSLKTPDLAILDIGLKGPMLGVEGAQILRKFFPRIEIIFATGYSDPVVVQSTASLRPCAYLVKPIAPEQVVAALMTCETAIREGRICAKET